MNMTSEIKVIQLRAANAAEQHSGDYVQDGILYCGKCHSPKEKEYNFGTTIHRIKIFCKCEEAERQEKERIEELQKRREKIENMRSRAFPESVMKYWTFKDDDKANEKITNVSKNYVANFDKMKASGKGLLFYGNVGVGKSFYAACIANALIDNEVECLMTTFSRLVNTISGMFEGKQKYIDNLNTYDLLVIDDLATERDTDYMNELVYTIIDARYRAGLPTVITTNLTAEEIKNSASINKQRIFSRILEMTIPVEVKGQDRRKQKLAKDYKTFSDLLGL